MALVWTERDRGSTARPCAATIRDPARPGAVAGTGVPGAATVLPGALRKAFTVERWLHTGDTGEASGVALAWRRTRSGRRQLCVVKLYRPGLRVDPRVRAAWKSVRAPGVVRLHDFGTADGQAYEVMADAAEEPERLTLRDLLGENPSGLPEELAVDVVRQVSAALRALGQERIAHLDVKPENLVVARRSPLKLVLVDLGIAVHLRLDYADVDQRQGVVGRTHAYAPREAMLRDEAHIASDRWSLGIVGAEVATGEHPYLDLVDRHAVKAVIDHPVWRQWRLPSRFESLVRALTAADPEARWSFDDIDRWVDGDPPDVPADTVGPPRTGTPFHFLEDHYYPSGLATAMTEHWGRAADELFGARGRWAELADWVRERGCSGRLPGAGALADRVGRLGEGEDPWPPDARLLVLLRGLHPQLEPRYRGEDLSLERLERLAAEAERRAPVVGERDPAPVLEDLWRRPLLLELDGAKGASGLAEVDRAWREHEAAWRVRVAALSPRHPGLADRCGERPGSMHRARLLLLVMSAVTRSALEDDVRVRGAEVRRLLGGGRLDWFEDLRAAALASPAGPERIAGLLVVHDALAAALEQAEMRRVELEILAARPAYLRAEWNRRERWRVLERPVALGWAAAGISVVGLIWVILLVIGDAMPPGLLPMVPTRLMPLSWGVVVLSVSVQAAAELWLAGAIGAPYYPDHALWARFRSAGASVHRRLPGLLGAAVVVAVAGAAAVLVFAVTVGWPFLLPPPIAAAHVWWAHRRWRQWSGAHAQERDHALAGSLG